MNERIKELRKQAWKEAYNVDPDDPRIARAHKAMEEGMAKFAKLIVKECIGCCENVISDQVPLYFDNWLSGGSQCIVEIKQHFGVEE